MNKFQVFFLNLLPLHSNQFQWSELVMQRGDKPTPTATTLSRFKTSWDGPDFRVKKNVAIPLVSQKTFSPACSYQATVNHGSWRRNQMVPDFPLNCPKS